MMWTCVFCFSTYHSAFRNISLGTVGTSKESSDGSSKASIWMSCGSASLNTMVVEPRNMPGILLSRIVSCHDSCLP